MELLFDHTFGKQEQQDLVICRPMALVDEDEEAADVQDAEHRGTPPPHPVREAARPAVVVLAPTRELAQQIRAEADSLASGSSTRIACVYGGVPKGPRQAKGEARGPTAHSGNTIRAS